MPDQLQVIVASSSVNSYSDILPPSTGSKSSLYVDPPACQETAQSPPLPPLMTAASSTPATTSQR
jgi:hypothetical protein